MSFLTSLSIVSRGYLPEVVSTLNASEAHLGTANIACDGYLPIPVVVLVIEPKVIRTNIILRRKKIIEEDEELLLILKTLIKIWH